MKGENKTQLVTRGKFNCRCSSKFNVCGSHQYYSSLTIEVHVIGNKTYHHRYGAY